MTNDKKSADGDSAAELEVGCSVCWPRSLAECLIICTGVSFSQTNKHQSERETMIHGNRRLKACIHRGDALALPIYERYIVPYLAFKQVNALVDRTSQYQNKRVPDRRGGRVPSPPPLLPALSISHHATVSPGGPCSAVSCSVPVAAISPSSCCVPRRPPPPEARGRRGGTGACDWPLHCTACREPVEGR